MSTEKIEARYRGLSILARGRGGFRFVATGHHEYTTSASWPNRRRRAVQTSKTEPSPDIHAAAANITSLVKLTFPSPIVNVDIWILRCSCINKLYTFTRECEDQNSVFDYGISFSRFWCLQCEFGRTCTEYLALAPHAWMPCSPCSPLLTCSHELRGEGEKKTQMTRKETS